MPRGPQICLISTYYVGQINALSTVAPDGTVRFSTPLADIERKIYIDSHIAAPPSSLIGLLFVTEDKEIMS